MDGYGGERVFVDAIYMCINTHTRVCVCLYPQFTSSFFFNQYLFQLLFRFSVVNTTIRRQITRMLRTHCNLYEHTRTRLSSK